MKQYWLLKSEPEAFSIDDLARSPGRKTCWEGVRNYQARNFMRSMTAGDQAFFYHSNTDPPAIVGVVEIVKEAYPDHYAMDSKSRYFDPKSTSDSPRWVMIDIRLVRKFPNSLTLDALRRAKGVEKMELLRRGSRLSVQPVREKEWKVIIKLAGHLHS